MPATSDPVKEAARRAAELCRKLGRKKWSDALGRAVLESTRAVTRQALDLQMELYDLDGAGRLPESKRDLYDRLYRALDALMDAESEEGV